MLIAGTRTIKTFSIRRFNLSMSVWQRGVVNFTDSSAFILRITTVRYLQTVSILIHLPNLLTLFVC
jgi:hypothetical protein